MIVVLFDKREFVVDNKTGASIERSLAKGNDGMIKFNGITVKKSAISYLMPGGVTEADMPKPNDPNKRLQADHRSEDQQHRDARKKANSVRKILERKGILRRKPAVS